MYKIIKKNKCKNIDNKKHYCKNLFLQSTQWAVNINYNY